MEVAGIDNTRERILVVDDEEAVRTLVVEMLSRQGFRVDSVESARDAVNELAKNAYTLVITDIWMPDMDGLELIKHVKEKYPDVCNIAMTGYSKDYKYMDVVNAGATDFINKPFSIEELEAKVNRAIIERNTKRELSRLSITDALTGLYNHRHFYVRLSDEITRAKRQKNDLAVIILDLDDFKRHNDRFGHVSGDKVLQKVGEIIKANIRFGVDSGYRYGGDEFAVILIEADMEIARQIGERIGTAIKAECGLTASFGYARFSEGMTPEGLVNKADERLYQLKGYRRNNVEKAT